MKYIDFFEKREIGFGVISEFPLDIHLNGDENSCLVIDVNKNIKKITKDCYVFVPLILDEDELDIYAEKLISLLPKDTYLKTGNDSLVCPYRDGKYGLAILDTRKTY